MSTPEPHENGASPLQQLAIAGGVLIVIVLTVVVAFFLATQDQSPTATPITSLPDTPTVSSGLPDTPTSVIVQPGVTEEPPTDTPTPFPSPTDTVAPTPTETETSTPAPPTETPTVEVIIITATPLPPPPTNTPDLTGSTCNPPGNWVDYTIVVGDTWLSIAELTDTSVAELQEFNCLTGTLQPGQVIAVPFVPPTLTPTPSRTPTGAPLATFTRTPTPFAPNITGVSPSQIDRIAADEDFFITVTGSNFRVREAGFTVELRGPSSIILELGEQRSDISFNAIVPGGLPDGTYDIVVTNPSGRAAIRSNAFIIGVIVATATPIAPPNIVNYTPTSGSIDEEITLTVQGTNFQPNDNGFTVELQARDGTDNFELDLGAIRTASSFEAIIRADTLELGEYNLVVINPDNQLDIASQIYNAVE